MEKMDVAIVVDCRSRNLEVFAASVTETADQGLVLRKANDLGRLADLSGGEIPHTVIILGSYAAQSSSGFASMALPWGYHKRWLAGGAGLGWGSSKGRRGDALRRITDCGGEPLSAAVIIGGCTLTKVGGHWNSNHATADAAAVGLHLRSQLRREIVILEGQSDYVQGWALKPSLEQNGLGGEFPAEHREEIFSQKKESEQVAPMTESSPTSDDEFVETEA